MKFTIYLFSILISLHLFTISPSAQTSTFTYQGRLNDTAVAANGMYEMQFSLFDAVSGGTQIGSTVTNSAVNVANGVFTLPLDFGAGAFPGADRFLQISVRPSGSPNAFTPLTPRQPMSSSPYAIKSLNANSATNSQQLGGVAANQFVVTTDTRMSDARPPTQGSPNYIQNSTDGQDPANFDISGTGSADIINAGTQYNLLGNRILTRAGLGNLFTGFSAGKFNTSGTFNTFSGEGAGFKNTSGQNNSFFGWLAGQNNTTGSQNSFFGAAAGNANTTGSGNVYVGYESGYTSTGENNSFVGAFSGQLNTSGGNNVFFGSQAGYNNSTGDSNSFIGTFAGYNNGIGSSNTFVGRDSGKNNTTGSGNIFLGASAGNANMIGSYNVFSGYQAGMNSTQDSNTFVGSFSGKANTSGSSNTFIGSRTGSNNSQGISNTYTGILAGFNGTTATQNAFFGGYSGQFNISGSDNSFFGIYSGYYNTTGSSNTFIGRLAGNPSNSIQVNSSTAIGVGATVSSDHTIVLGTAAEVTQIPGSLTVSGALNATLPSGSANYIQNTTAPQASSNFNISGNGSVGGKMGVGTSSAATGLEIRRDGTPSSDWQTSQLRISGATDPNKQLNLGFDTTTNAGVIQAGQAFTGYKTLYLNPAGGGVIVAGNAVIPPTGNMSVSGLTIGSGGLQVINLSGASGGSPLCGGGSPPYIIGFCSSSFRYKTNISKYQGGFSIIRQLDPVGYDWKQGGSHDIGLGAEDVEKIDRNLVFYNPQGQVEGVRYDRLGVVLVNAAKEQQKQIDEQKELINAQQHQIDALKAAICEIRPAASVCNK